MTTTRVIRREVNDTSDPNVSASTISQDGAAVDFNLGTLRASLSNTQPNSSAVKAAFSQDLRITDDLFNIPAERCIVTYKCRPSITTSSISGGLGVQFDIDYNTGSIFGFDADVDNTSTGTSSIPLRDLVQTGSAVTTTTASRNDITEAAAFITVQINTSNNNSNGLHSVVIQLSDLILRANTGPAGSLNRKWEADNHVIDGVGGDSIDPITVSATLTAVPTTTRFGEADITTPSFSVTETSVNKKFAGATSSSASSFSVTPKYISDTTKTLSVVTDIISSTDNLVRLDVENYSTSASMSISPSFIIENSSSLSTLGSTSPQGNMIYDIGGDYTWDTINAIALENDQTWDDFDQLTWETWTDNTWGSVLESWDEWDLNVWARSYNINAFFRQTETILYKAGAGTDLTSAFNIAEASAFGQDGAANLTTSVTMEPTASGLLKAQASITGAFSPTLNSNIIYDQPSSVAITGAFNSTLLGSATLAGETVISSSFAFAITPTHRRGPFQQVFASASAFAITPTRRLGPFQLVLPALVSTLQTARLVIQADPFNIITVGQEGRTVLIPTENRITLVDQENRVNTLNSVTRTLMVPQETRSIKLRVPPLTDRLSTPRVRSEI